MHLNGTVRVGIDSNVTVQIKVNDVDLDLEGDTGFDNPVAASVDITKISNLNDGT